ncbi:MAG: biotin--[acetyl-CoA-carboxylase] ligase [Magnetococcales bacterium]|nr:biotin--[acetyl-CoA-carboxylase] ligase [Magnetococcales bacterium]
MSELLTALRLARGSSLSGKNLGERLGISRAAIWKRIRALNRNGYVVEARRGMGYRLVREPDVLTWEAVAPLLPEGLFQADRYHYLAEVGSSNEEVVTRARQGAPEGTVVVAESQTHGRGRLGRRWNSPPGMNLYFSCLLRPDMSPNRTFQLTLLAGLALAEAVQEAGFAEATIKWPNDLLLRGRKLAGILTEMSAEMDRVHYVVVGVGLNVHLTTAALPSELRDIAIGLADVYAASSVPGGGAAPAPPLRRNLLVGFLGRFQEWYQRYRERGFGVVREAWMERARIQDRRVTVHLLKETFTGTALEMDPDGFLLVRCDEDQTIRRVVAGDVAMV